MPEKNSSRSIGSIGRKIARRVHIIFPTHLGDVFTLFVVVALAAGGAFFWYYAWLPSIETQEITIEERIPRFSEEELDGLVEVLEGREEASTAPVVPPARNPFLP